LNINNISSIDVSVVIPAFNAEKTISKSIQSVLDQSFKCNIEIIVVDDGSADDTYKTLKQIKEDNRYINIILLRQKNKGVSSARNKGLKIAKGNWIALLDSDDEWLPNKLERQFEVIRGHPDVDFLGTTRNNEHFNRVYFKKIELLTKIRPRLLLYKFVFVVPTVIFKRTILDTIGYFDENQRYAEEGNFFIRISNHFNCYLLNESLVLTGGGKAHFGVSGLSSHLSEMEKGELRNLNCAFKLHIIGIFEYSFLIVFSILKYFRRILIAKLKFKI
jgi:glycosyltransferase involved in cell wall biosynthesis